MESFVDIKKQGISAFTPFARINSQFVTESATIPPNHNATSLGPIQINNAVVVTIGSGSNWKIDSTNQAEDLESLIWMGLM